MSLIDHWGFNYLTYKNEKGTEVVDVKFKIPDLASNKHYNVLNQQNRWWIFDEEGNGVEIESEALYSMIDKYFKENV